MRIEGSFKGYDFRIVPLNECAILVDFGRTISPELNDLVLALAAEIESDPFEGFTEAVPAYSSLAVFFHPFSPEFRRGSIPALMNRLRSRIRDLSSDPVSEPRTIELPVSFSEENALDLEFVAVSNGITPEKVIDIFLSFEYRVYMLGFLPGFAYMGKLPAEIATPRKPHPRGAVPKGSVGIAGDQTGVYPFESPGGWQIIGRTEVDIFDPGSESPTLFEPGDTVRFIRSDT